MSFLYICTLSIGNLPQATLGFYPPGQPGDTVMATYLLKISGERVPPPMQHWQSIMGSDPVHTNYVYESKKQCFYYSGPPITQTHWDPTVFIFMKNLKI